MPPAAGGLTLALQGVNPPASIENGEERLDYYPGTDEELLEKVLKKGIKSANARRRSATRPQPPIYI